MHNDTIKAENKIISNEDLSLIFQTMSETLNKYKKISEIETQQNKMIDYMYQKYSFRDSESHMKVIVDFYDDTSITFDSYENFIGIFYNRLDEIKTMNVFFILSYSVVTPEPTRSTINYSQHINMYITEKKLEIDVKMSSEDRKIEEIYQLIKNMVLNAPEKYDMVIKEKKKITNTVAISSGIIPACIISLLFLFIPVVGMIFLKGFVVYPICSFLLAFIIGGALASSKLDKYYSTIVPEKMYAGYQKGYKDDIDSFVNSSEILIGKKVNNKANRENIKREYEKSKSVLSRNLGILGAMSVIVIIIGLFF